MLTTRAAVLLVAAAGCSVGPTPAPGRAPRPATATEIPAALLPPPPDPCARVATFRDGPGAAPAARPWTPLELARAYLAHCGTAEAVALTQALVRFPTIRSIEEPASGPSFQAMAAFLRAWAEARGLRFTVQGVHDAWEIAFGSGPRELGFALHGDVVPAGALASASGDDAAPVPGWTHPPFAGVVADGRVHGRGAEDDKGPIAAVLVAFAALAGAGVTPAGEVLAIIGLGEEHDWGGMQRYVGTRPLPRQTVSVDAEFPVVVGESGFVVWQLAVPAALPARPTRAVIVDAHGGEHLTQVPGEAHMVVAPARGETVAQLAQRVANAVAAEEQARGAGGGFRMSAETDGAGRVVVRAFGEPVHASLADRGKNALWPLASLARRLKVERAGAGAMLEVVAARFDGDHVGQKLRLTYGHPRMGKLLVSPNVLRVQGERVTLGINMRRPAGMTSGEFARGLDAALARLTRELEPRLVEIPGRFVGEPHLVSDDSPLVQALLDVYRQETGDRDATPVTIRGGTYARLFPGAVSFGPVVSGGVYRGHAPNEFLEVAELERLTRLVFAATVRLAVPPPASTEPQARGASTSRREGVPGEL